MENWVEDAQLNWKSNDFGDLNDQQISFEVSLKNSAQLRAEQSILDMGEERIAIKQAVYRQNQLLQKLQYMIGLIEQEKRYSILRKQRNVGQLELNNWKASVLSDQFRPDKLQQADLSLDEIWANELDNNAALKRYQPNISNTEGHLAFKNALNIRQILSSMQHLINTHEYEKYNPAIRKATLEMNLAKKLQQRESAKDSFSVDSLKLQYDNKDAAFGASVGIRVPLTKSSFANKIKQQKIYYSKLELNNVRSRLLELLRKKEFTVLRLQDEWNSNLKLINKLEKRMMRIHQTGNTKLILDLKSKQLDYGKRQSRINTIALKEYLTFLHQSGMLAALPSRNWLLKGAPFMDTTAIY